jgi:hypothetical protein
MNFVRKQDLWIGIVFKASDEETFVPINAFEKTVREIAHIKEKKTPFYPLAYSDRIIRCGHILRFLSNGMCYNSVYWPFLMPVPSKLEMSRM